MARIALALFLMWIAGGRALPGQPHDQAPDPAPVDPDHLRQLQTCREGIVDPGARADDRRRWVELLFSYRTPQANALIVELLSLGDRPEVVRALCQVIADRGAVPADRLDASFVDPLIDLLGAESDDVRAAASRALADFPGVGVPQRLGAIAADEEAPLSTRLGAVDALAPNTHRRDVVGHLIGLLAAAPPEVVERVVAALEPLTAQTFGQDVHRWQAWWQIQSRLDEEVWLADQLRLYRERLRRVSNEFRQHRDEAQRTVSALSTRMGEFQRELFRLSGDQQDARLVEWLRDALPEVKQTALAIIKARIGDEGKRPEGEVLSTMLTLLRQGGPGTRRSVLEIVQNLSDPAVVQAVLTQLDSEQDPATRLAMFKALGRLKSPEAVPALIRELENAHSAPECVREAAVALGGVAGLTDDAEARTGAVAALKVRFQNTPAENVPLRTALVNAMAGIGDPSFASELLAVVDSDEAGALRWAIRGLRVLGDRSKLPRIRTLMEHPDPLVRIEAIEAVGKLGREDADVERLLTRLNPANESNERAREAAWEGFCEFWNARPVAEQVSAASRLRELPHREIRYLQGLAGRLSQSNGRTPELEKVLDRLVAILSAQERWSEAAPLLRDLCELKRGRPDQSSASDDNADEFTCHVRLLEVLLRAGSDTEAASLIRRLSAETADPAKKDRIIETVRTFLDSPALVQDAERTRALLGALRSVPGHALGQSWTTLLDRVAARLPAANSQPPNKSSTPGN